MARKPFVRHDDEYRVRLFVQVHDVKVVFGGHRHNAVVGQLLHITVYFGQITR